MRQITRAEILAKQKVRIRTQYGKLCELEIEKNISEDQLIGSNKNLWTKEIAFMNKFGIFCIFSCENHNKVCDGHKVYL